MADEKQWTPAQQDAISCRGGTVLVSAAAGSGKTAVLVQRVIEIITDQAHPVDANQILVVTFTNAAAAEMKQRIAQRLSQMIAEKPSDTYLLRQQSLLSAAQISTVDAFCLDLVRSNFQALDLPPDFRMGGQKEIEMLEDDIAQQVLERSYEKRDPRFSDLVELVSSGRDDSALIRILKTLYNFLRSHPFYHRWLDAKLLLYDDTIPVADSQWGQVIVQYARNAVAYATSLTKKALEEIALDEAMSKAYQSAYEGDLAQLEQLAMQIQIGDWDSICQALGQIKFQRLGSLRGYEDTAKKEQIQAYRKSVQGILKDLNEKQFCATSEEFREDIRFLKPIITTLFELVKAYDEALSIEKRRRRLVDFADIEHFAVNLLVEEKQGKYLCTGLARLLSQKYQYVLVDEYQDTNETQDMIFQSIARENNLFMVGDVKQSIYRFRQAMPEIFIQKRNTFSAYDGRRYPAKISLSNNFRSRPQVTDCINYIFAAIMSEEVGEIAYDDKEWLVASAKYPEKQDALTEMHLIENTSEELSDPLAEAVYVAGEIEKLLDSGFTVSDGGEVRAVTPGDICILLRSPKNKAELYTKALGERGINSWADSRTGFLGATEISTALSVLRAVDNPLIDIHLTAAMMSPVFGFTADDMAIIRMQDRASHLYFNCVRLSEQGESPISQKCRQFLDAVQEFRILGASSPIHLLIQKMIDITGLWDLVSAMKYGESRKANLRLLIDYARDYEMGGQKSVSGFLRYIDRILERGEDLASASMVSNESDAVRVMSIHRSKGLEFPVVFLCDTSKKFNVQDLRSNMLLHSQLGFACLVRDLKNRKQYTTVPMEALKLELERSMLSEEMRILYVAMTRAKEKLIITSVQNNLSRKAVSLAAGLSERKTVSPYIVRSGSSYADWLLMGLVYHPDGAQLCADCGCSPEEQIYFPECRFDIRVAQAGEQDESAVQEELAFSCQPDESALRMIRQLVLDRYPDRTASCIPSKLSVSEIVHPGGSASLFEKAPAFLKKQGLTASQRGTAMHTFLTCADHLAGETDLEREIDRLAQKRFLTFKETESLDRNAIKRYYQSDLYRRVKASSWVKHEFAFMMDLGEKHLKHVIPDIGAHLVTVQGIADLLFEEGQGLVLVDFKTDHVSDIGELSMRYAAQLSLYAEMIENLTGKLVREKLIYSLWKHQEVALP